MWILILGIIGLAVWLFHKFFKVPKTNAMVAVTGEVKSGKSTFSFWLAYKNYKRNRRAVKIANFFRKLFDKPLLEEPLFYTTIPVGVPHVLLTRELLNRKERFRYKSVIWVDEASLLIDNGLYKEVDIQDNIMLFHKLISHETRGGMLVLNTQSIGDVSVAVRRCIGRMFYVHSTFRWIPFFIVATVREERFSEEGSSVNTYENDLEESLKRVVMLKSTWKKFDCYCYSSMTDNLPVNDKVQKAQSLKAKKLISFNPRHSYEVDEKGVVKYEKEVS